MSDDKKIRDVGDEADGSSSPVLPTTNVASKPEPPKTWFHPAFYVIIWIAMSSSVIIFNKYILDTANFSYPVSLTCWHLVFSTIVTQIMARFTHVLDSRKKVPMTGRVYLRAVVPIGFFFSLSLICGNLAYLYLSVSFIQMLKATVAVAVLITGWALGVAPVDLKKLGNVSFIVIGVMIASFGEIKFDLFGFLCQAGGIMFEAIRLVMIERLLSSAEFKMDPLVSLYYYAPVCAVMNFVIAVGWELPRLTMGDIYSVGVLVLFANAIVAFALNVSVVFLVGKTSSLVLTLCGVLKDVLLVCASLIIFRDPVSGLQVFGYSIALFGLVYYKLGAQKLKESFGGVGRQWSEYGAKHPAMRKFIIFVFVLFAVVAVTGGIIPWLPETWKTTVTARLGLIDDKVPS